MRYRIHLLLVICLIFVISSTVGCGFDLDALDGLIDFETSDDIANPEESEVEEEVSDEGDSVFDDESSGDDESSDQEDGDEPSSDEDNMDVTIYMPNDTGHWMEKLDTKGAGDNKYTAAVSAWQDHAYFLPSTDIWVNVESEIAEVSFGSEIESMELEYEGLAVQTLVNTLTQFEEIDLVQILVEGEEVYSLAGSSYVEQPLQRDESLIATEDYTPIAPADPRRDERFIEGTVESIDPDKRLMYLVPTETMGEDKSSISLDIDHEVVIHRQVIDGDDLQISISDISDGDEIGSIISPDGYVRAIIILE